MMKRYLILLAFVTFEMAMMAQSGSKALLNESQRLYSGGDYATALTVLGKINVRSLDTSTRQEVELLRALATFETNALEGRALLLQYIDSYPTAKESMLNSYIAESYYYTGDFGTACTWFAKSDMERLPAEHRDRARLHYALSLQECNDGRGTAMLREIAATSRTHGDDAKFHLATAEYDNGNLDEAYKGFKQIEFCDRYYLEVPYYIAGIYLKQGDAARAKDMAVRFIADHGDKPQGIRMQQILGAAEYAMGNYAAAIEPLTSYIHGEAEPQRIAYYQLGLSLFETGSDNARALEMFEYCSINTDGKRKDDAITQNSLLHSGIIRLRNNDISGAAKEFGAAAAMKHDQDVREEAMYNHALCMHGSRNSVSSESVKLFEQFLNEFPTSKHASQAAGYLAEVYTNSQNYDLALQSIARIKNPGKEILKVKQNLLYQAGLKEFNNGNMAKCISYMDRSIVLKQYGKETYANAEYLKGEALYGTENYKSAAESYRKALSAGEETSNMALYGLAYSMFQLKSYNDARAHFERLIKNMPGNKEIVSDAHNRIADCYFYQRRYADADKHYRKASQTSNEGADYALYRSALTLGLAKDYEGKVKTLKQLIEKYPGSAYIEQSYHEMARAYIELENFDDAVNTYDSLIGNYPQGELARRAATEKAMIYNTTGNREKAAQAYKEIIEKYPGSEEAQVAIQDLKSIYVETGDVDKLAEYATGSNGAGNISNEELDSLTYMVAEKAYVRGDKNIAKNKMQEYITKFPDGTYKLDSHYYLGLMFHEAGNTSDALKNFRIVIDAGDNKYTSEALYLAAGIEFDNKRYDIAKRMYQRYITASNDSKRILEVRTRIMRAAYILEENEEVITYANDIITSGDTEPSTIREAIYCRAKANIALGKEDKAMEDLVTLGKDTRTKEGAEAKYILAQMLFDQEEYNECEKEVLKFIEASTPHGYWLARGFILLADTYMKQGKSMEAKQYLLSLQNNYEGNDDIAEMIATRLEAFKE